MHYLVNQAHVMDVRGHRLAISGVGDPAYGRLSRQNADPSKPEGVPPDIEAVAAQAKAAGAAVEVDISALAPGEKLTVEWRGKPVWILKRTPEQLAELPELDSVQTEGAAQPLFDRTEHMPVKVGEADTLDATEPDFAPRLAKAITEAEQEGARHVELKLAPEHLGKLSVELTQGKEGVLHIVFHAENEQAMKLLQEHSATLVSMLHGSHSGEIQVEVPRPQQGEQPWQQPEQQPGQQHGRNPQEQGRQRQSTEDFLQQLRLGLLGVEAE